MLLTDTNYETSTKKAVEKKDRKESVETPTCEECSDETAIHAVFVSLAAAIFVVMVVNGLLYFRSRGACTFLSRDFEKIENGSQSGQQNDKVTVTEDSKQDNDAVNSTA